MSTYPPRVLAVPCPKCPAKVDEDCHTIGIWGVSKKWWSYRERPHKERVARAAAGPKGRTLEAFDGRAP